LVWDNAVMCKWRVSRVSREGVRGESGRNGWGGCKAYHLIQRAPGQVDVAVESGGEDAPLHLGGVVVEIGVDRDHLEEGKGDIQVNRVSREAPLAREVFRQNAIAIPPLPPPPPLPYHPVTPIRHSPSTGAATGRRATFPQSAR
jgi:hypothetical protein